MSDSSQVRIDKWLWAARFYKMRSLATDACKGSHILSNGVRCKPSKIVSINDEIQIRKEDEMFTVVVTGMAAKRGSATMAQTLYHETENSLKQRALLMEQRKFKTFNAPSPEKRPSKKDRRKIKNFKANM